MTKEIKIILDKSEKNEQKDIMENKNINDKKLIA